MLIAFTFQKSTTSIFYIKKADSATEGLFYNISSSKVFPFRCYLSVIDIEKSRLIKFWFMSLVFVDFLPLILLLE